MLHRSLALLAAAELAVLLSAAPARAAAVVGGSSLLDAAGANQLESWLGQGPITLTNIFTKTPGATAADFHAAADGRGATFAVMRATQGAVTGIIGGYNPLSWSQSAGYQLSFNASDRTAFIFNLSTGDLRTQAAGGNGSYQTFNYHAYGPTFGGGHDIQVNSSLSAGYSYGWSYGTQNQISTSILTNQYYCNFGCQYAVGELEVFTISAGSAAPAAPAAPVPEPLALSLFVIGLAGLGVAHRRRRA